MCTIICSACTFHLPREDKQNAQWDVKAEIEIRVTEERFTLDLFNNNFIFDDMNRH